jgi:hypothetical protein
MAIEGDRKTRSLPPGAFPCSVNRCPVVEVAVTLKQKKKGKGGYPRNRDWQGVDVSGWLAVDAVRYLAFACVMVTCVCYSLAT